MINVSRYNQFAIQGNLMQSDIRFMIDSMTSLNLFLKSRIDLYEQSYERTVRYVMLMLDNKRVTPINSVLKLNWMTTILTSYVTIVLALSTFMNICTCSTLRWLSFLHSKCKCFSRTQQSTVLANGLLFFELSFLLS